MIRSEQIAEESTLQGNAVGGVPGALANQPSAEGGQASVTAKSGGEKTMQATRNYEVDRTIAHTRHQVGKITRLTVAVAVDDHRGQAAEGGTPEVTAWSDDELNRLRTMVSNAVGFDEARGDVVNIINKCFVEPEAMVVEELAFYEQDWFNQYAKLAASVVVIIVLVLGVMRPMFAGITAVSNRPKELESVSEFSGLDV